MILRTTSIRTLLRAHASAARAIKCAYSAYTIGSAAGHAFALGDIYCECPAYNDAQRALNTVNRSQA